MITYTEFILFGCFIAAIAYALYWRGEAHKWNHMFKLMLTNEQARTEIVDSFNEFKRKAG